MKRISDVANAFIVQLGSVTEYLSLARFGIAPLHTTREDCADIAIDADGFIYCGGFTNGRIADSAGGGADIYIAKFSPRGEIVWITQLGANNRDVADGGVNNGEDQCVNIAVDADKNVYCSGYTNGNIGGAGIIQGARDGIVLKLNSSGQLQWIAQTGALGEDGFVKMAIAPDGSIFTTGYTLGDFVPGERTGGRTDYDLIVSKFSSSGVLLASRQIGETTFTNRSSLNLPQLLDVTGDEFGRTISVTKDGHLVVGGTSSGNFFGANGSPGTNDLIAWKFDTSLNTIWANQIPSASEDSPLDSLVEDNNNIVLAGQTTGHFGEAGGGARDIFVARISPSGSLIKVSQLGSVTRVPGGNTSFEDNCFSIAQDREGNIYCGGRTYSDVGERNADPSHTTFDLLIVKFNRNLDFAGALQFGAVTATPGGDNSRVDHVRGIAIDYFGNLYVGGETQGALGEPQAGLGDFFVMKIDMSTLDFSTPRF